ncbi:MAG: redoxin domain-containing protein [Candidatus Paceibacterota bacterium]
MNYDEALNNDEIFVSDVMVGHKVPDFEFEVYHNEEIKKIRISDYKGKWLVLFFYPADFTFVCPTELEEMAGYYKQFQDINTEIISMSADTVFAHKAWHDTSEAIGKITFPMGADPTGNISRSLGIYIEEEGVALRGTFIIDPDGELKAVEVNHNDIGRSAQELYRKLQAAQFVASHDGQVCPASWNPGDDTLLPGLNLVGKI